MTVIDTLITILKVDSKDLIKGLSDADKKTEDLKKDLTESEKTIKKFQDSLKNLAKELMIAGAAFVSISSISSGFMNAGKNATDLKMLADTTNSSMSELSAWGHATVEAGGSADAFRQSAGALNDSIQELALTGDSSAAPAMRALGLNFLDGSRHAKPLTQNLMDIAGAMEGMDKQKQIEIGKRLGLDQGTIFLLMRGRNAVDDLMKKKREIGALDEKNAMTAIKFNVTMDEFSARMEQLYMSIGSAVVPVLNLLGATFGAIFDFFGRHQPLMYAGLAALAGALWFLVSPLLATAAAWLVSISPILLFIAAIAAVLLIGEDLWAWFNGGDSVIGDFISLFDGLGDPLFAAFDKIKAAVVEFWNALAPPEWLLSALGVVSDLIGKAGSYIFKAEGSDMNGQTNNSVTGGATSTTNNNIRANTTVNTQATDAAGTAKAVNHGLGGMIRSAMGNSDDGVAA